MSDESISQNVQQAKEFYSAAIPSTAGLRKRWRFIRSRPRKISSLRGMAPEEARHAARRQFGNATKMKEQSHEAVKFWFETVAQDVLFRNAPATKKSRIYRDRHPDAGARHRSGRGDLRVRRCGADQAIALCKPKPAGRGVQKVCRCWGRANLSYLDYLDWKKHE